MNKKGFFMFFFAIIVLIVLVAFTTVIVSSNKKSLEIDLGGTQIALIEKYHEGEKKIFEIEKKSLYAKFKTLNDFSNFGGLDSNCKKIDDYYVWEFNTDCEPKIKENFIELFKNNINTNLDYYQYSNEDLKIENNFIVADAKNELVLKGNTKNSDFVYKIKPNFKQDIIDLNKYENLKNEIKNKKDCLITDNYNNCLIKDLDIKIIKNGNILKFDVNTNKEIIVYDNGIKIIKPVFKFAIDIKNSWKNQLFT